MKNNQAIQEHIVNWLLKYCEESRLEGFIIGISGGIDSALTSVLCAMTNKKVICLNMPLRQNQHEYTRAVKHIKDLEARFENVTSLEIDLTDTFATFEKTLPANVKQHGLSMANSRARLRMTTLYAVGQANNLLVVGTGNKVEDFGIGFFTKYGDGGVDISPIADLYKTEVFELAKYVAVNEEIVNAKPTDGLWDDERNDEDQIGATYEELEWVMENINSSPEVFSTRQKEVLAIYLRFNRVNRHKMEPIPVCIIPKSIKK
ncbi:MAG: NAD(+) synthase [Crocinitomicaceae bacterium]